MKQAGDFRGGRVHCGETGRRTDVAGIASADVIASWDFEGFAGTEATAEGSMPAGMEISTLTRGGGLGNSTANPDSFNATGFLSTLASALAADSYFTFNLEASANYMFSVDSMVFNFEASPSGPQSWALFSSATGFDEVDALNNWISVGSGTQTATLSGVSEFQVITGSIEFRVYGYEASLQSGTGSFEGTGNDVTVHGEVVPEPATMGLLSLGALALAFRRKRQK